MSIIVLERCLAYQVSHADAFGLSFASAVGYDWTYQNSTHGVTSSVPASVKNGCPYSTQQTKMIAVHTFVQ